MEEDSYVIILDDSDHFDGGQKEDPIISDSEEEGNDPIPDDGSNVEKHVIEDSSSPSSNSYASANNSFSSVLDSSVCGAHGLGKSTLKASVGGMLHSQLSDDSHEDSCLAPDSDESCINLTCEYRRTSIVNGFGSFEMKSADSAIDTGGVSLAGPSIKESDAAGLRLTEMDASECIRKNQSIAMLNLSSISSSDLKSERDRSSCGSLSSVIGEKALDDSAVQGDDFNRSCRNKDSLSSLKESASPCLTEKQKCLKEIQELANDIKKKKLVLQNIDLTTLPDRGVRLQLSITTLEKGLKKLKNDYEKIHDDDRSADEAGDLSIIVEHVVKPIASSNKNAVAKPDISQGNPSNAGNLAVIHGMDSVTMDALKNLHDSLKTCPAEDVVAEDPEGLNISLMPHQRHGLAWMLWRESQVPSGGILADDMGLGKTLSMISLILKHKQLVKDERVEDVSGNYRGGTLIVCPTSLLGQWKKEVECRCKPSTLTIYVHHGTDRSISKKFLKKHDIVITTYGIVMRECASIYKKTSFQKENGPLLDVEWSRIILDEAHVVRNYKSQTSQAVSGLKGRNRWALTGTPIHNKELDLFALIVFIRCSPFDKYMTWRRWVDNKTAAGAQRLNMLMKSLMLRRTKEQLQSAGLHLPSCEQHHFPIELHPSERAVYDQMLALSRNLFAKFMDQHAARVDSKLIGDEPGSYSDYPNGSNGIHSTASADIRPYSSIPDSTLAAIKSLSDDRVVKSHHLLVLLLRLRQICCHPGLIQSMLEDEDYREGEIVDDSGLDVDLITQLNAIKLLEAVEEKDVHSINDDEYFEKNPLTLRNPVFKFSRPSSKINALFKCLEDNILETSDKAVIVSQWTSVLDLIGDHLKKHGIKYQVLSGCVPLKMRTEVVENFNCKPKGPKVLLLSLKAGGVGLNLVGGNHLLLVDLHWNPQLEAQACDRIYRVGQQKCVHIYRFICKHTVEEKISELQEKKLSLADNVLTGAKNPQSSKLSLEDLKVLFSAS